MKIAPDPTEILGYCFDHFYGLDVSNAATHCAAVRFSPITFRLAELLTARADACGEDITQELAIVIDHLGSYAEDTGR